MSASEVKRTFKLLKFKILKDRFRPEADVRGLAKPPKHPFPSRRSATATNSGPFRDKLTELTAILGSDSG